MKHTGYTPGIWRVDGRKDDGGRTMPHIDVVSYGINAERIVVASNLFVRDAALIADAPRLAEENERLRAMLLEALPYIEEGEEFNKPTRRTLSKSVRALTTGCDPYHLMLAGTCTNCGFRETKAALAGRDTKGLNR